ncbi:MAG: hypothetical protein ACFE85_19570, partial [Candidatus Hodarchaeota archaeon]
MIEFEIEDFELEDAGDYKTLKLPELSEEEINIIDPIVAPTSGLRIQIFDIQERDGKDFYFLTRRKLFLFLRVFKAISIKYKELNQNQNLKILIVSDSRPSRHLLMKYCSQIFAYDEFDIYYQKDLPGESLLSSPYGAASVALLKDINLIIVLTASHNDLSWNGIKFYINYPIPISGDIFKDISKKAIALKKIDLKLDYKPKLIDAEKKNNNYVRNLLSHIIKIKSL